MKFTYKYYGEYLAIVNRQMLMNYPIIGISMKKSILLLLILLIPLLALAQTAEDYIQRDVSWVNFTNKVPAFIPM